MLSRCKDCGRETWTMRMLLLELSKGSESSMLSGRCSYCAGYKFERRRNSRVQAWMRRLPRYESHYEVQAVLSPRRRHPEQPMTVR